MAENRKRGRKPGTPMTDEHKAALAAGREEARVVKTYLEALESVAPKRRGRKRTKESVAKRLVAVDKALPDASALARLQLLQEKADLARELSAQDPTSAVDLTAARKGFVKVAKAYSARKRIEYSTWRAAGVDAETLKDAGISRSA